MRAEMSEPLDAYFDDLDMELNETLIRVFSTIFKIKDTVVLLDKYQWADLIEGATTEPARKIIYKDLETLFGKSSDSQIRAIYLNPSYVKRTYQALVSTIIHELLHIKYPKKNEDEIYRMERDNTGRYDYIPLSMKCGNCCEGRK